MRGERVPLSQLAEEAVKVEIDILKNPIGKQDQYAAAFGGMNYIRFLKDERVSIEAVTTVNDNVEKLFNHIMLFWTGKTRKASDILSVQKKNTNKKEDNLIIMRDQAEKIYNLMRQSLNLKKFSDILTEGWRLKRDLANTISNDQIDYWYDTAVKAGALAGKLCGAGGGGFLLFIVPLKNQNNVRKALAELKELKIRYEPHGSILLIPNYT